MITICYVAHPEIMGKDYLEFSHEMYTVIKSGRIFIEEDSLQRSPEWYAKEEDARAKIARGEVPFDRIEDNQLWSMLYKTKVKWIIEKSPISKEDFDAEDLCRKRSWEAFYQNNLPEALDQRIKSYQMGAKHDKRRDVKLAEYVATIAKSSEDSISITRGLSHTLLYHNLCKTLGFSKVRRLFVRPTAFCSMEDEIVRRLIFSKDVSEGLVLRSFADGLVNGYYRDVETFTVQESISKSRQVVERLSERQIKDLSLFLSKKYFPNRGKLEPLEVLLMAAANLELI